MPTFVYTAKLKPKEIIQGNIDAESEADALNKIARMGYFPLSVGLKDASTVNPKALSFKKRIRKKDIVLFTRQLSSLVESGVNLLNSLNIVANQTPSRNLKSAINDIAEKIKNGRSLSESLSAYPNIFPNLYTAIILSGEVGGNLEQALSRLADFLEKEDEFRNSVRSSLIYPSFIFFVGTITVVILLYFVIPRLVSMFSDMGQILPLPTRILIGVSASLQKYGWLILSLSAVLIFLFQRLRVKPQGRLWLDRVKLRFPLFRDIILKTEMSRMSRTLMLLLSGGIPMLQSLNIVISILENQVLKSEVGKFKDQIASGSSFSRCLKESKIFPAFVTNIVTIGEETGALEKSFLRISESYEKEVDRALKTLTQLLEPLIILLMGIIVGFIVLSMLLPIFQMNLIVR